MDIINPPPFIYSSIKAAQEAEERWKLLMIRIGRQQAMQFASNPQSYVDILVTTESVRHLMKWVYCHLVKHNTIQRIEDYAQEEKQEMWDLVVEKCSDKCRDKTKLKEVVMVFCAIEFFINENK